MARNILLILTLAFSRVNGSTYPNDSSLQIARMAGVCKVWGFVKYYQPNVTRKKIDWDIVFINTYENIKYANDFEIYNQQLKNLLAKAMLSSRIFSDKDSLKTKWIVRGELSKLDNFKILNDTSNYIRQPDFSWIKNDAIFSKENQSLLFQIIIDYKPVINKYLTGRDVISHKENPFSDIDSVGEPHRMLALFRYWNIVNYFFPYKNLTDKNWDSVLIENIPRFMTSNSYYGYFCQIQHLTTGINDSHAWLTQIDSKKGLKQKPTTHHPYYLPLKLEILDKDVVVISKILTDSLVQLRTIQKGDILLKVNDKEVNKAIFALRNRSPYSTEQSFRNGAKYSLLYYWGDTSLFNFIIVRGYDTLLVNNIKGINSNAYWKIEKDIIPAPIYYAIEDSIGYINLDKARAKDLKSAYHKYKNFSTIIFDIRGYPPDYAPMFLPKMFSRKPIPIANYFYPSKKYAGVFIKNKSPENWFVENAVTLFLKNVFNIKGKITPTFNKIYKGKVVVLINNEAISYAETVCMIFKAYVKNATFIGVPTQGANQGC